jgi:hypothetical protein
MVAPWGAPNQWLKRPLLFDGSIERMRKKGEIKGKIVSIVYIEYIVFSPICTGNAPGVCF